MHIDPQQELYTAVRLALESKNHTVYEGILPPDGTPYPFDYMGDVQQIDVAHKKELTGIVNITLHTWHSDYRQRGTMSKMLLEIKEACRSIQHTKNFAWNVRNITQRIIPDNTTAQPLLHGIIEAEFYFS